VQQLVVQHPKSTEIEARSAWVNARSAATFRVMVYGRVIQYTRLADPGVHDFMYTPCYFLFFTPLNDKEDRRAAEVQRICIRTDRIPY
jgi:hypothetical protein